MSDQTPRAKRPLESFRTDAYQAGWLAFESGAIRDGTPCQHARPSSAWYDWRAGFDDRAYLEAPP